MSKTDPGALADSISDGSPIDWDDVEKSAGSAEERHELKRLFHVHRIAEFNRGLQRSTVEAAAGPADAAFPALSSRRTAPRDVGQWGPLTLVEKLGEGATGEVWRAWEERLQRDVALKLMKPSDRPEESTRRLLEEGSHLARIRHDGVARVYGIETHDGRIGLWMELLDGEPLDRIVQQRGPFSPGETLLIGAALCRALAAVHGAGLLHRDVKAQNVIRTDGGRIVLTDFGLGSPLSAGTASMRPDAGVPLSGTPMYMAPEVLAGEPASIASEIFSLGVLLYYAVSGQYPIEARSLSELSAARIAGRSRPLRDRRPDLPVRFIEAVDRALSLEPARRYRSAGEMETALLSALKESGEPVSEPRSSGRRGFAPGIFAALVFLAIAAGVFLISRRRPAGPETASVSYDVEASFVRLEGEHETPLLSGERVAPGDRLGLDLRATRPLYIYVLNEDEQG